MSKVKYTWSILTTGKHTERLELLYIAVEVNIYQSFRKTVRQYIPKLYVHLPYDSAIPLLYIYPEK